VLAVLYTMRYGSVCSGIEAATVAWHGLGWEPAWFSEILPFPSEVLKYRYEKVPNLGDMTQLSGKKEFAEHIDLLVGGTPCQDFSQAGKRGGLEAQKGNLTLEYIKILESKQPQWFVWENVPGVLSLDGGRVFGTILRKMAECGYGLAYRVLDSRYFGLLQSRPRVFVVGYLGNDRKPPAKVLLDGPSRNHYPAGGDSKTGRIPTLTLRNAGNGNARGVVVVEGTLHGDGTPGPYGEGRTWQIRACTPGEEEKRQGFPGEHTRIPWNDKPADECPDKPRYEAIGNSMAVPVMRWIGERIEEVSHHIGDDAYMETNLELNPVLEPAIVAASTSPKRTYTKKPPAVSPVNDTVTIQASAKPLLLGLLVEKKARLTAEYKQSLADIDSALTALQA
jgi:DNA (cytosine-5)-methyltransferase 1